jgi:hypothetical protein
MTDRWDEVERSTVSKIEPVEARMTENRASMMRIIESAQQDAFVVRERQQKLINEQVSGS